VRGGGANRVVIFHGASIRLSSRTTSLELSAALSSSRSGTRPIVCVCACVRVYVRVKKTLVDRFRIARGAFNGVICNERWTRYA